ncbi:unnamed protein product [Darwinula stevensoni]|uniref:Uncharacterized protein n=1 Tax=Darwinula stevensoni TaxID=69355 RepID=A0A7R8WYF1_9CRUS|nr:unnamed protein product [Darwinula stevensoni]CAG0878885.1 unnamed protein product [Darwinula stevensoni]
MPPFLPECISENCRREKRFRLQNKMTEMLGRGKSVVGKVGGKGQEVLSRWEEKSWEYINNFLLFFGKEGIGNIWKEGKSIVRQALSPPSSPGSSSPPTSHNGNSSPDLSQCPPYKMRRCNEDPEEYSEDEDEEMPCSTKADAVSS